MALSLVFTVNFDLDSDSATFGKFVFEDISDYAAAGIDPLDVEGIFTITSPLGVARTGSFTDPDINGATSDFIYDGFDIPQIAIDQYLLGGYTFLYTIQVSGTDEQSTSISYTFCPPTTIVSSLGVIADACESHTINSICNILDITNTTNYGAYTTLDTEITLSPPALTALPDVTANALTLSYQYYWVSVAYSIYINSLVTYVTGNVTVTVRVDLTFTVSVSPAKLAAELMACFVRFTTWYMSQAALKGGAYNLNPVLNNDMQNVGIYISAFNAATQTAAWTTAEGLIPTIEAIINQYVSCNCGCDTTLPRFVDPYCNCDGSGSGSDLIFQATYPVVVTRTGDTIRYSLDPTFLAELEAITQVTIESSDGSVEVGVSPDYDLSVKNSLAFTATFLYAAGNDLSVTVTNVQKQGDRYLTGYPVAADDIQVINYPHGSVAALEAEYAVFYIKDFLTTPPGVEISDKIDISEIQILNAGASATDFSQPSLFDFELFGRTTLGFYFRLVDAATGLPISMADFINSLTHLKITCKINE